MVNGRETRTVRVPSVHLRSNSSGVLREHAKETSHSVKDEQGSPKDPRICSLQQLKAFAIGCGAGGLGSLVGMGGGFVMVPAMTAVLKLTQHQAHGTSLAAVTTCGMSGAFSYMQAGHVDWVAAASISATGMLAANFGALAIRFVPVSVNC